jgi:hypothetical protein
MACPTAPHQRHSDTSAAAAEAIGPKVPSLRAQLLGWLRERGEYGATDEEIQTALWMAANTQRPRRVELVESGQVRDSGKRRLTSALREAVVWVATSKEGSQ